MSDPQVGDRIDVCAIWLSGLETPEMFRQWKLDVAEVMSARAGRYNLGPVIWTEKKPGDERVPPVPPHIQGPDVRLLVGEAVILGVKLSMKSQIGFTHDLEPDDLALLRRLTRRQYERTYPGRERLTDRQCDTLINDLGPQAALDAMRAARRTDLH